MKNTFISALRAIFTNKSRSFLTMLGVIIGVASVVLLTSIGNGLQLYITDQFESLGSNNIIIAPGQVFDSNGNFNSQSRVLAINKLRLSDVQELKRIGDLLDKVIPVGSKTDKSYYQQKEKDITIIGTTTDYAAALNTKLISGQFFGKQDELSSEKVVVIGFDIADELFGKVDPIGKKIKIGSQYFKVIGVAEKKGASFGGPSFDTYGYMPLKTYQHVYDNQTIVQILAKGKSKDQIPEAIEAIQKTLEKRLKPDDFSVFDQSEILKTINQILGMLTIGLGGIAAISLVVGGIGIMNIMLVSVTERTREIGLRKALGATPNQILLQFLIEAAILSIIGGLIGLVIAYLGSLAIQSVFPARVTIDAVILSFGVSTIVGLVFGAAPARRASQLSPIEALRYE